MISKVVSRGEAAAQPGRPAELTAFCVIEREDGSVTWIRCGRARPNRDGSINVVLEALPLNGELHLRPAEPAASERKPVVAPVSMARPTSATG